MKTHWRTLKPGCWGGTSIGQQLRSFLEECFPRTQMSGCDQQFLVALLPSCQAPPEAGQESQTSDSSSDIGHPQSLPGEARHNKGWPSMATRVIGKRCPKFCGWGCVRKAGRSRDMWGWGCTDWSLSPGSVNSGSLEKSLSPSEPQLLSLKWGIKYLP